MESDAVVHPTSSSLYTGGEVGKGATDTTENASACLLSLCRTFALQVMVQYHSSTAQMPRLLFYAANISSSVARLHVLPTNTSANRQFEAEPRAKLNLRQLEKATQLMDFGKMSELLQFSAKLLGSNRDVCPKGGCRDPAD